VIFTPQASASYSNEPKSRRRARILGLATAVALSSIGLSFADQPAAPLDRPILASSLVQAAANPGELLQQGIEQFNRKEYEEAVSTLQQVDASSLPDAQKQTLASTLAQAQSAANQRKAARAAFEQGETALGAGDPAAAIVQYRSVINNTFADAGTRAKATEQLALATADLQARGLPVPAEGAAPAAPTVTDPVQQAQAKEAYDAGVAAYNAGDFPLARQKFTEAGELGYVAGTFETAPAKYVEMIEHKDQLDALRAARAAIADMRSARQPEPAPAVEPVPSAPQTSPAVVQDTPPVVEPTPSVEPAPAGTDLAAAARAEQLARAQARIEAEKLVQQAEVAVAAGRFTEAGSLYDQAIRLDPENQRAIAGKNDITRQLGLSPVQEGIAERMEREVRATRDRISFLFNTNLNIAGQSIEAGDFGTAEAAIQSAEVASLSNPTVFTQAEVNNFSNRIAVTRRALASARQEALARATAEQQAEAARTLAEREREFQRQRGEALTTLRRDARRLSEQGNYEEAIAVVDQILAIDRNDDYATGVRPLLLDRVHINKQKEYRDRWHTNMVEQFIEAEEKKIPYSDILNYPANWPDLSERRERTVQQERGGTQQDSEARALLDRELPELRFDQVPFADAIEFLRDSTQANIFVNWRAMELEAVDRNAPVSLRLRNVKFSKVLRSILDDVGGGTVKLGYTIDEGVITISTLDDLAQNVDTRVYDIRDLIINIPDFTNAPEFNLDGGNGQGGTGGGQGGGFGGGGGGGGGLFGGGGGGGGGGRGGGGGNDEDEGPSRAELVEDIILLITETIATDTWKDNGGTIGSLRELQGQLIVTQTPENQNAIAALLEKLRETRAIQVNIETRFLTVARNFLEDVGVDFDFAFNYNNTFGWNQAAPIVNPSTGLPLRPINSSGQGVNVAPVTVSQNSLGFTAPNTLETGLPGNLSGSFATPNFSTSINAFLDDFQASLLIRASQGSRTLTTLTAPRVTLFNGQRAYVFIGLQQAYVSDLQPVVGSGAVGFNPTVATLSTGVVLDVTATVSADRKYVTLTLRPQLTRLLGLQVFPVFGGTVFGGGGDGGGGGGGGEEPVSGVGFIQLPQIEITEVRTTVSVPDGGTLLLGGQTVAAEIDREAGVPVLSKVPFLKRLFTNRSMAKDESVLLILVKPTIIIQREIEEERYPGLDR
jgi:type II secretory pathway component GspD/PulD (secretin)/tetratricopeptide (TPR) repeat protein